MRYRLATHIGQITLRPYEARDIPFHVGYLYDSPRPFLEQIAFDVSQFPERDACEKLFREELARDMESGVIRRIAGELEERTISLVTLEIPEDEPVRYAHFHILDSTLRGEGLGVPLFVVSLKTLMDRHGLDRICLEPSAHNPPINRLAEKLGVSLLDSYEKAAGLWALHVTVNRYEVTRARVEQLLDSLRDPFQLAEV